jgi:hypothetical protein
LDGHAQFDHRSGISGCQFKEEYIGFLDVMIVGFKYRVTAQGSALIQWQIDRIGNEIVR